MKEPNASKSSVNVIKSKEPDGDAGSKRHKEEISSRNIDTNIISEDMNIVGSRSDDDESDDSLERASFFMLYPIPLSVRQGRYTIIKLLGSGGMARVFLAKDALMNYPVVLKEMPPLYITHEQEDYMKKRFREEARLLYRLRHKNLPRVTDYFIEGGSMFLVMDYIEGENLEELTSRLPGRRIKVSDCLKWLKSILEILQYLHSQDPPIIHRDIKPSNLMLTKKGEIFLVDFGTARASGSLTFTRVGTPGFASIDHFTGKFSPSSDLFSLGATFHYLLSGDDPANREDFTYPPLSLYRDDVPNILQQIMEKMLQLSKVDRYQSANEVLQDLEKTGEAEVAGIKREILPASNYHRKEKVDSTATEPKKARISQPAETSGIKDWVCLKTLKGHAREVSSTAFSPGGRYIATGSEDNTVKLWDADKGAYIRTFRKHTDDVSCVLFSPNDKYLVSGSRDCTIKIHDAFRGTFIWTLTGHNDCIRDMVYSDDGGYLISCSEDKTIRIWDTGYRVCVKILNEYDACYNSIDQSPDGELIASASDDGIVRLWNFETGNCLEYVDTDSGSVNSVQFSPGGNWVAAGCSDGSVQVFEAAGLKPVHHIKAHRNGVNSVAYTPDGKYLASCSDDRTIKIWDMNSCELIREFHGHSREVKNINFSPEGKVMVSSSADKTVKIWGISG